MRFRLQSGLSLRYKTRGAGRTVVLLHPVAMRAEFWDPVIAELESDVRLIAIDIRGHGESDVPDRPFSLDELTADVIELVRAVGSPPCVMVGCSMGVMIANWVAVKAPELVRALVLSNATHTRTEKGRAALQQRADAALNGMPAVLEGTLSRWFSPQFMALNADVVAKVRAWFLDNDPVVHCWSWLCMRDRDYGDKLAGIRVPVLAIAGSNDDSATPSIVKEMSQVFPRGSFYLMEGVGHFAPLENPRLYARVLRDFIKGLADENT
ncbi:MAG TPA: alpha/beta fold hydrolase [Hyphomicrobiaceae bacterium]|nr:alpha/beta fold hydrolase [Hyphomicrobiaceae bacterium]